MDGRDDQPQKGCAGGYRNQVCRMSFFQTTEAGSAGFSLIVADNPIVARAVGLSLSRTGFSSAEDLIWTHSEASRASIPRSGVRRTFVALEAEPQRGLQSIRRLRSAASAPVFAIGPRDAGLILDTLHAGATDYIEDAEPLDEPLTKVLSRHQTQRGAATGRLLCVASATGGCGSSVVAVNLAVALAQRVKKAGLCDLDLQSGVCDALLNLKPKFTIVDLGRCLEQLDRNTLETAILPHDSGVHLLPAPLNAEEARTLDGKLCERIIQRLRQSFPVVVADLPRLSSAFDSGPLLSACDRLIIVTRLDFNAVRQTRRAIDLVERAGFSSQRIHIVWNRSGQPNELSVSKGELALNRKDVHLLPDDPKVVNRSINCGMPFVLETPHSKLSRAVASLTEVILEQCELALPPEIPAGADSGRTPAFWHQLRRSMLSWAT